MNFLLAPLWITGVVVPGFAETLKPLRFLSVAVVVTTATVIYLGGKDYYLFPLISRCSRICSCLPTRAFRKRSVYSHIA